jgi:signal transduction histidine kinase
VDLTTLAPISEALGADKPPKELLQLIIKAALSTTRATSASLMLVDPDTATLRVEIAEGFRSDAIYATRLIVGQGVTGWVAETGVPLRLGNVKKDPRYVRVQRGLRSELAVPMRITGRVIGVISVDSTRLNHFTAEDEALLAALAAQSARVIQSMRLYEEIRQRAEELELLNELSRELGSSLDLRQVLAQAVEQTARACRAAIVSVFLIGEDGATLEMAACFGGSAQYRDQPPVALRGSLLGDIAAAGKSVIVSDIRGGRPAGFVVDADVRSLLAVPLLAKERPLGVLCVFGAPSRIFDVYDQRLLESVGRAAALAIENARSHRRMLATEEALREAEKLSLLGELAGGLAHEIRNPLTSVKVLFGTLAEAHKFSEEGARDAEMIRRQIARLESIVEGFLATVRNQATPAQTRRVDLNAVVDEAMLLLASSATEGTRLWADLDHEDLIVQGDPTQLSQVIYNLVLNGIQAIGRQGRVGVATRLHAGTAGQPAQIIVEVADDGPGLAESVAQRLFQPFVTTKKGGVGLGLAIVKRIVEAHGGRIEVESPRRALGRGALFRVILPAAGQPACREAR